MRAPGAGALNSASQEQLTASLLADAVAREKAEQMLQATPAAILTTAISMAATAWLLHTYFAWRAIAWWVACVLPLYAIRLAIWAWARHPARLQTKPRACLRALYVSATLAGLSWTPLPVWFFAASVPFQMFLTALLLSVASAAMGALSPVPVAALLYMLPIIVPLVPRLLAEQARIAHTAGWLIPVYIAYMATVSGRMERLLRDKVRIRFMAVQRSLTDPLTGLPNRAGLDAHCSAALARARRHGMVVVVFYIDLNGFKALNDRHGHAYGDQLLRQFAHRLNSTLRAHERLSRIGGDEFALVLQDLGVHWRDDVAAVANRLTDLLQEPFRIGDTACTIGMALGSASYPEDAQELTDLLACADARMYAVKLQQHAAASLRTHMPAEAPKSGRTVLEA